MAIPCFVSTCSIDLSADENGLLVANANLSPTGSLACEEPDGQYVEVSGLVGDATSAVAPGSVPCGQSISRDTNGALFAYPEGAVAHPDDPGGDANVIKLSPTADHSRQSVTPPANYNNLQDDVNVRNNARFQIVNPFQCDAWCMFQVTMKLFGNRLPDAGPTCGGVHHTGGESFFVSMYSDMTVDGVAPALQSFDQRHDHYGSWSGPTSGIVLQDSWIHNIVFKLDASGADAVRIVDAGITTIQRYHINLDDCLGNEGGVGIFAPNAIFWRDDQNRP